MILYLTWLVGGIVLLRAAMTAEQSPLPSVPLLLGAFVVLGVVGLGAGETDGGLLPHRLDRVVAPAVILGEPLSRHPAQQMRLDERPAQLRQRCSDLLARDRSARRGAREGSADPLGDHTRSPRSRRARGAACGRGNARAGK